MPEPAAPGEAGGPAPGDLPPAEPGPSPADSGSASPDTDPPAEPGADLRQRAAHRRALDALFGDVLPDITADETDRGGPGDRSDRWYAENRPPHHG